MSDITRRDILHGAVALPLLGAGLPSKAHAASTSQLPVGYPPGQTGMRGSHAGSFEVAHALATEGRSDFGDMAVDAQRYDLVVVGAGVSGLAAAYFYRQQQPDARILILDNHDDFGGHAKRNEFSVDGRTVIGYGGSQSLEAPSAYSDVAKKLLRELSIDLDAFDHAYDQSFFEQHGLRGGMFFDRETYGASAFVDTNLIGVADFLGLAPPQSDVRDAVQQMPLSPAERAMLEGLLLDSGDAIPEVGLFEVPDYLGSISYLQFINERCGVDSPTVINLLQSLPSSYFGIGIDGITALDALAMGMPGAQQLGVPGTGWLRSVLGGLAEPYIHHFPDGNASVARLLVRSLIPGVAFSTQPADLVTEKIDYSQLDRPDHNVRIRLSSTAVRVDVKNAKAVVNYVSAGQQHQITASHCVLACYNMMIPYICPGLPAAQKSALSEAVKIPLVYTNVALRNWHALKNLGIGQAYAPNMFHQLMMVDFPVSMGAYQFSSTPDDPVLLHMSSAFGEPGLPPKDQFRIGRARLLATTYAEIEADLKNHLGQLLGPGGFDADRDIAAITVNRWPHGYAYGGFSLFDPQYPEGEAPHEVGRKTWGPVAIANSDAGNRAYLDEAVNQAYRAVSELVSSSPG